MPSASQPFSARCPPRGPVADYRSPPAPNLGVVRIDENRTAFVIADIPGLIEGAADGAGQAIVSQHLQRTRPAAAHCGPGSSFDPDTDLVAEAPPLSKAAQPDESLYQQTALAGAEQAGHGGRRLNARRRCAVPCRLRLAWKPPTLRRPFPAAPAPLFVISALTGERHARRTYAVMDYLVYRAPARRARSA